jgi:hypothetical protein
MAWATHQPTIAGVALVGSYARGEARPDSDIDVILLCTEPRGFLTETSWIHCFGEVRTCHTEAWGSEYENSPVQLIIAEGHIASERVVQKCGFTYEGTARQAMFARGRHCDMKIYSLLRHEAETCLLSCLFPPGSH